jgi:hypothetical protein
MGSGGTGAGGAGGSGGGYNSNGWGGTMGSGGNAYSGGGVGGIGTAGTMSGGAGGSAMGGFGNTGAGGSGMAGISTHSGETPAGFTPSAGDPRGTSLGMDAFGNYKGSPGYAGIGSATANRATTMTPKAQMEMFGYVKYPSNPPKQTFSTAIPTTTNPLTVRPGQVVTPGLLTPNPGYRTAPSIDRGMLRSPSVTDRMSNPNFGNLRGAAPGSGSTGGPNRMGKDNYGGGSTRGGYGGPSFGGPGYRGY